MCMNLCLFEGCDKLAHAILTAKPTEGETFENCLRCLHERLCIFRENSQLFQNALYFLSSSECTVNTKKTQRTKLISARIKIKIPTLTFKIKLTIFFLTISRIRSTTKCGHNTPIRNLKHQNKNKGKKKKATN